MSDAPPVENPISRFVHAQSLKRYGADRWGSRFLTVNNSANLEFRVPGMKPVDLQRLAEELASRGVEAPFVVRFPGMIAAQMKRMNQSFDEALRRYETESERAELTTTGGTHIGVYPIKVNQRRAVVDTVVEARSELNFGLEAGSKPELLLAMAQPVAGDLPLICNGFKDREYIRMAHHAAELGHNVVIVIESAREVKRYIEVTTSSKWTSVPALGVRAKLYSRRAAKRGPTETRISKFGLTTSEILAMLVELEAENLANRLCMLHFHCGTQISKIKDVKQAIREGTRLWGDLQKRISSVRYLNVGGGLGVDYDGSRTSHPSSANYSMEEYAHQVVFDVRETSAAMGLAPPTIVTESGRALVASHAVTITDLRELQGELLPVPQQRDNEHRLISELRYTLDNITAKNIDEYFHDAVDYHDEALQLFIRGYLTVEERSSAEGLFHRVRVKCSQLVEQMVRPPEEIVEYLSVSQHQYAINLSVFQSLPNVSSRDALPAAPLAHHDKTPSVNAQIVDITCDSTGAIPSFAHPDDNVDSLPLHKFDENEAPYYLGFFLSGAYRDTQASSQNLFSRCHEVIVRPQQGEPVAHGSDSFDYDGLHIELYSGMRNRDVLELMDYNSDALTLSLRDRHIKRQTTLGQPWVLGLLQGYPYLTR